MKNNNPDRFGGEISRRKFVEGAGKAMLAIGAVVLSACVPKAKKSSAYLVKIQYTQSRSHFDPSTLIIPAGSQVTWQNQSIYPATVTCDPSKVKQASTNNDPATSAAYVKLPDNASPWDSGTLYPGQTWTYTFKTSGEYLYFSQYDQTPELVGIIKVQ